MKINTIIIFMLILLVPIVLAITNLDFRLDVEEKGFYPNEKIPLNVTVINRDTGLAARDAELTVNIGSRFYTFDLGDLEPGEKFQKEILLPEFPAGTHSIKGEINYTGILDERFIEVSYGSFEVLFPPIERYPRNVFVSAYDLPEKIIGGKSYDVSITITNDGEVDADLLIEFGSIDEFFEEKTKLKPSESTTVKMSVKFENPGVSLIEARAYALINGEKYLLNYRGKKTYVQAERKAKFIFDRIELISEGDNEINEEDEVKFKIFIKNEGDTATDVNGMLSSDVNNMNITDSTVSYVSIISKDSVAPNDDIFELETRGVDASDYELNLKLNYVDSENREKEIKVPITISEGGDSCTNDNQCSDIQACQENKCVEIECTDGYVKNHECIKYECVRDSDCKQYYTCDLKLHICKPPQCTNDIQCRDNEVCYQGKCREAFNLVFVPINWNPNEFNEFRSKADIALTDFLSKTPFNQCSDKEGRVRAHYINPNSCQVGTCEDHCTDCISKARDCMIRNGLEGSYNKFIAITKGSWSGGCASGIPGDGSSTDARFPKVVIHEFGHSVGLCHIPLCGARCGYNEPEGCSWCPNYEDILKPQNNYIMSYCSNTNQFGPAGYNYLRYNFDGVSPTAGGLSRWLNAC